MRSHRARIAQPSALTCARAGANAGLEPAHTDYHRVAHGFGAKGYRLDKDADLDGDKLLAKARDNLVKDGDNVVVNMLIGKTKFRDGSISV